MNFIKSTPGFSIFRLCALGALLVLGNRTSGQSHIKGMKVIRMPLAYLEPTGKLAEANAKEADGPYATWKVFCDRDGNQTFKESALTTAWKTIGFMQVFFVLERKGNSIHIAKYTNLIGEKNSIPDDSLDYGWVDQRKILLWKNCLVDSAYQFSVKGLVIRDPKVLNDPSEFKKLTTEKFPLYTSPDLTKRTQNDIDLFDFLYIFKNENGAYLVGKTVMMTPQSAATDMLGWVSERYIRKWSQRICLEPNAETGAIAERKKSGLKVSVFESELKARKFQNGEAVKALNVDDLGQKEMLPPEKRLPVISDLKNGIVKTGFITAILNEKGDKVISTTEQAENEKKYNQARENYRVINIVFVVEGSAKLKEYITSINNAIQTVSDRSKNDQKNTYRFGAVVYRNYSYPENEVCTFQDLSNSSTSIKTFLQKEFEKSVPGSLGNGSAMYEGIKKGVHLFAKAEQNNYIILIGYSGNDFNSPKSPNEISLKNDLASMHSSLVAFQVQYNAQDNQKFASQAEFLIKESADKIRSLTDKVKPNIKSTFKGVSFVQTDTHTNNEFSLKFPGGESPVPGMYTLASPGRPNVPEWIGDQIVELVDKQSRYNDKTLSDWDASIKGIGNTTVRMSEELYLLLLNSNIDPIYFQKLDKNTNVQLFIESYAVVRKSEQLKNPLFNYVLFVDDEELNDLINIFKKLGEVNTPSEIRTHLINCYREMAQTYFGNRESKKSISKKTLGELNQIITGLPSSSDIFKKVSIADIENNKVPLPELSDIIDQMNIIKDDLTKIKSRNLKSFVSYDKRYFWIPASVFR